MTLVLKPETEHKRQKFADSQGCDANALGNDLLSEALADAEREFEETVTGIDRGWQEGEEGCERTIEEYMADVKRRKQANSAA